MIVACPHCHNVFETDVKDSVVCPKCKERTDSTKTVKKNPFDKSTPNLNSNRWR